MIKIERVDTLEEMEFTTWSNEPEPHKYEHIVDRWYKELAQDGADSFHWIMKGIWKFFQSVAEGAKKKICFTVKHVKYAVYVPKLDFYEIAGESTIPMMMLHSIRDGPPWFPGGIGYTWMEIRSYFTAWGSNSGIFDRKWYVYAFCAIENTHEGYTIMRARPLLKIFDDSFAKIAEYITASYNPLLHEIDVSIDLNGFEYSYFPVYNEHFKYDLKFKHEFAELYSKLKQLTIM